MKFDRNSPFIQIRWQPYWKINHNRKYSECRKSKIKYKFCSSIQKCWYAIHVYWFNFKDLWSTTYVSGGGHLGLADGKKCARCQPSTQVKYDPWGLKYWIITTFVGALSMYTASIEGSRTITSSVKGRAK